jgi:hypothetical protein
MSDTPHLALPYLAAAQAQKHVTHNEALSLLDGLVQAGVKSRTLAAPPASPQDGDRYLVAVAASGGWTGQSGKIAMRIDGGWHFITPREGWHLWVDDEDVFLVFDGTGWSGLGGVPDEVQGLDLLGVNATADAANRLTVSSAATLFNHAGAGHQLKINKAASADTASLLFQTGYSGRAEMGTAGNDDFQIKVSSDGSAFNDALSIAAASGAVTAHQPLRLEPRAADPASPQDGEIWYSNSASRFRKRENGITSDLATSGGGGGDASVALAGAAALDLLPVALRGRKALTLDLAGNGYASFNDGSAAAMGAIEAYAAATLTNSTGGQRWTRKRLLASVAANALRLTHDYLGSPVGALFEAAFAYLHTRSQPTVAEQTASNVVDAAAPDGWSGTWTGFGDNSVQRFGYLPAQATTSGQDYCSAILLRMDDGAAPVPGLSTGSGDFMFANSGGPLKPSDGSSGFDIKGPFANNVYLISWYVVSSGTTIRPPSPIKYTGQSARGFVSGARLFGPGRYPPSFMEATGTAPSRAADVLSLPVSGFTADEITVAGAFTAPNPEATLRTVFCLRNGADKLEMTFAAGSMVPVIKLTVGGVEQFGGSAAALAPGTSYRFHVAASRAAKLLYWKFAGLGAGSVSPTSPLTATASFTPAALDVGNAGGTAQLSSSILSLAVIDRAWTAAEGEGFTDPGGVAVLSNATAALAADVQLVTSNTFYDGPSVTLAAGTWLLTSQAQYQKTTTTASQVTVRLSDGSGHYASQNAYHASVANVTLGFAVSAVVSLAAVATIKLQMATTVGNAACLMKAQAPNNGSGNNATVISAVRIQ